MKKSLFFSAVALCALTITGCNKEVESPEVTPRGREIHFTINAGAPETKTFIEYDNVNHKYVPKWQNADKLGVIFNAFGESKKAADAEFTNTLADGATASFSGTGTVSGDEQTLYAFYPASAFGKAYSGSVIGLDIPDTQKPTATSFDPAADILVNDPYALTIDDANVVISDMQFRRVGSVLRLTITDGTSTGKISSDKIKTVTVSSNMANAAFAGRYRYDFVGKKAYYNNGTVNEHMASKIASVTADLTDNLLSVGDPIFLVVNPQDLAADSKLTVQIATDNHNISKEITLTQVLPFRGGTMTSISVGIKDDDTINDALETKTYVLVKDAAELTAGAEVIIADYGDANGVMSTNQQTNNRAAVTVEKSADKQSITTDNVNVQVFTIAAGNKANTIAFYDGQGYLYAASSSANHLKTEDGLSNNSSWEVTIDSGTGEATVVAQGSYTRNKMRYNPNSGNPIFACYASGSTTGTAVSIYKLDDNRTPSGLAWDDDQGLGDINDLANIILPNLVNPNSVSPVTYSSSDPTVATVLENEHTVTLLKAGTTQIHAIFAGNATYRPADVYYTLTVENNNYSYDFETVAELNALVTSTSATFNGYLTNAVVSFVPATNTAIIKDATGSVMYFKSGHGLKQGQTYTGTITVTAIQYNSLYSEITAISGATFTGAETVVAPESIALSALVGHYSDYQNAYVQVANLTVVSIDNKNINVTDGVNNYVVYYNPGSATAVCSAGDVITAAGTVTKYQTTEEIKVWSAGGITVTTAAPAFSVDKSSFSVAATVTSVTVNITANVEWSVTPGTGVTASPTSGSTNGAVVLSFAANTDTENAKNYSATISATGFSPVNITIEQAKASSGGSSVPDPETIVFGDLGLTNSKQYSDPFDGGNFTITFGGGGNDGKYYNTGSGIRTYGGGTITIESTYTISEIEFTWDGSYCPSADNASPTGYSTDTKKWTGSANSVVLTRPSGSGHWRLKSVTVHYSN